ncbi:MAG: DJ-1 family glyoxalase III [Myxococcota bacterium]
MVGEAPRALVLLAEGAEEMEAIIAVDVLRRGEVQVTVAGVDGAAPVTCSRGVRIVPDAALADVDGTFDAIVLPGGGGGAERLAGSEAVGRILTAQAEREGLIGAICAGPKALVAHGIGRGRKMTCHPSAEAVVSDHADLAPGPVVRDGFLVTSRGPGTAFEFALALVERLQGDDRARSLRGPMILD